MRDKKILIISKMFFPELSPRAFRTTELAKELARIGFDVTVYSYLGDYDYTSFKKQHNIRIESIGKSKILNNNSSNKTFILRAFYFFLKKIIEYPDIKLVFNSYKILKKEKKINLLITIGAPHSIHWGVAFAKKILKNKFPKKWIADCGDPYMGNPINVPFFYFQYLENFFCQKADFITVPILDAVNAYNEKYRNKIKVIPQGFNLSEIDLINHNGNDVLNFAYAGSVYKESRDPRPFLDFLIDYDGEFKFVVYTNNYTFFKPYKDVLKEKLILKEFIPRLDLLERLQEMDFVINFENSTSLQLPSKLIDYALINLPILSINTLEMDLNNIKKFMNKDYTNRLVIKNIEKYDIKNVVKQFLNI